VCAQEAFVQLELDRVLWVPVGEAPHRDLENDPGAEARVEMVELAVADDDRFEVSRVEVEREGPSYTSDTLRGLSEAGPDDELFLILGGDQAASLPTWHEPDQVLSLATVAVVERSNWSRHAIGIKVGRMAGVERIRYLEMPLIQISSSMIRRRAAQGRPVRYLVPDKVATYIESNGLYGAVVPEQATA
jgi:nicotinate-nucleotide adenylyltransferase